MDYLQNWLKLPAFRFVLELVSSVSELLILGQDSQLEKGCQQYFADRAEHLSSICLANFYQTKL